MYQTFLPIIKANSKRILGLYGIARTNFVGTETTFTLADGVVNIGLWPHPKIKGIPNSGDFMAALPTNDEYRLDFYKGHTAFIPVSDVMPSTQWVASPMITGLREWDGVILRGLKYTFDQGSPLVATIPPPTVVTPANLSWDAVADFIGAPQYKFFAFNWVTAFQAQFPTTQPAFIKPTTQPAGNTLRAVVVSDAQPVLTGVTFNTIRIVNVSPVPVVAGTYTFGFDIYDRENPAPVSVVLNLSVQ